MNNQTPPKSRLALFDFDGTLCRRNSWHLFLRSLLMPASFFSLRLLTAIALRKVGLISRAHLLALALGSLTGKTRAEIEALGQSLFQAQIAPHLNETGMAEMKKRQREGFRIVILSGAFDFLLKPFCDLYQISEWHSTSLAFDGERCLGKLAAPPFLGEEKRRYLLEHFANQPIDWAESCAYSDELVDLPLFSVVGNRYFVMVNQTGFISLPEGMQRVDWNF